MSYRLLRFLLVIVGLAALGGFGYTFYDFLKKGQTVYMKGTNLQAMEAGFEGRPSTDLRHLKEYSAYEPLHKLNYTGELPPPPPGERAEAPPPPPVVSADDLELAYIQYVEGSKELTGAFIAPRNPSGQPGDTPVGDLYREEDRFGLPSKPGVELEVVAIQPNEVELAIVGQEDGGFTLVAGVFEVSEGGYTVREGGTDDGSGVRYVAPDKTVMAEPGLYHVGESDFDAISRMPEDEILAAVQTRPRRDPATGEITGLYLTRLKEDSVFTRQGFKEDDVLLDVNGFPVTDRAELLDYLRKQEGVTSFEVRFERAGGVRSHTYRLPPR